jgi:hypothetical protein
MAIAAGLLWSRIICALVIAASIFNGGSQMSALQRRIAIVSDMTANLIAELRELDRLREQVREALLSVRKSQRQKRRNGHGAKSTDRKPAPGGSLESAGAADRQAAPG